MDFFSEISCRFIIILMIFSSTVASQNPNVEEMLELERDASTWYDRGRDEIDRMLSRKQNLNVAKNIIIFIGDGMGVSTVTGARIRKGQQMGRPGEETVFSFEKFDDVALSKTYSLNAMTPDSAATANAILSGVKSDSLVIGFDGSVKVDDCAGASKAKKLKSVLDWAHAGGKRTGIVTTARVTHATPAAAYAHTPNRFWEVDTSLPNGTTCKDIARQLIEDNKFINVVMGGGRSSFLPAGEKDPETNEVSIFQRIDGRNLIEEWKMEKERMNKKHSYVWNRDQFKTIEKDVDYILGLFNPSHMDYDAQRVDEGIQSEPSLEEMVEKAISVLKKGRSGYVLIVEGARIDHAHHVNIPELSFGDVIALDKAVQKASMMTKACDTLTVVTADHSHGMDIIGYPSRGSDILGKADFPPEALDGKPLPILQYSTGPGHKEPRENLTNVNTETGFFQFPSAIPISFSTHSGEDVAIYAHGPMSHLINGVKEQSYIAFVLAYSTCIGPYGRGRQQKMCLRRRKMSLYRL